MSPTAPPAGWYDDPMQPGVARWWDGTQWTDHVQMLPAPSPPPAPEPTQAWLQEPPRERRSWWRQRRVLVPAGVVSLAVVASVVADAGRSDEVAVDTAEATADELDDGINRLVDEVDDTEAERETTSVPPSTTAAPSTTATTTITTTESSTTSLVEVSATDADGSATSSSTPATTATPTTPAPTTAPPTTAAPTTAPPTTPAPTTAPPTTAATTNGCHPAYSPCIPFHPGDALNCGDLSSAQKPVTVLDVNVDPYGLDGDNDGRGCESG